jgi:hypothetical protein
VTVPPDVLARLLDAVTEDLAVRLATRLGGGANPDTYDSLRLPARCTRRRFAEVCRSGRVAGARREGRDWVCSRLAWEASQTRKRPLPALRPPCAPSDRNARADALLARSGLRILKAPK